MKRWPALAASLAGAAAVHLLAEAAPPATPKAPASGAVRSDWPRFLGPADNATSPETKLRHAWEGGLKPLWQMPKGEGFSGPAIVGDRLVLFSRQGARETIDCVEAATGKASWQHAYEAPYQDRYGSGNGPRNSPVIAGGRVFTFGVTGRLTALELATGRELWHHDCEKEFELADNFFGHGSTPLVLGERLIVQLGGKDDVVAAAFDVATGKLEWRARHEWGSSYASPIPATLHGRQCILLFAGGESRPPTGGLLCLDAADGKVLNATPHRAEIAESVNASSPVVAGNSIFVTESYGSGGELIEIAPDFSARTKWKAEKFGAYFMTPVVTAGAIVGCDGQSPRLAELVAQEIESGRELWRDDLGGRMGRMSLLLADGGCLCLGEFGDLAWLHLDAKGVTVTAKAKLFHAPDSWTLPALAHGLLYVCQNQKAADGQPPRLLCYDLRGE